MQHIYLKHWAIAMGLLLSTAILCSLMQYFFAIDIYWVIVFVALIGMSFIVSSLLAWLQVRLKQSFLNTAISVGILSLILVGFYYLDILMFVDWAAVSDSSIQLTMFQKIVKSDAVYWITFTLPFIFSITTYMIGFKSGRNN